MQACLCLCRDIKPSNLVLDASQGEKKIIEVFLVDFGGVQATVAGDGSQQLGSTVIGTYGSASFCATTAGCMHALRQPQQP